MTAKPFLKWAGGKRKLLPELLKYVPETFGDYHEPFLGGGALFFELASSGRMRLHDAFLSDSNEQLMKVYEAVRNRLPELLGQLEFLQSKYTEGPREFYLNIKQKFNKSRAENHVFDRAMFVFLNKTCFNGLYRLNKSGEFNVPWGKRENVVICDEKNLTACFKVLKDFAILPPSGVPGWNDYSDFSNAIKEIQTGDFVYLDPPYLPLTATSNFTGYTSEGFTVVDQIRLRDCARTLLDKSAHVLLSNSAAPAIRELYSDEKYFRIHEVDAARSINSDGGGRGKIKEFIIEGIRQ